MSTIAPGQSVTLSFPATISSVPPTNIITNTVNVSYTNASNTPMSPLSDSVSVSLGASQGLCNGTIVTTNYPYLQNGQATVRVRVDNPLTGNASLAINCGNGSSFSTIGTNLYATCTYTTVGTQPTIQMTVNGNTSPSCTVPVTVRQNTVNRCGDGYVGVLEQCDMGNGSTNYNGGTIGDYLDNIGRSLSSYQYRGSMCSSSCTIQ